MVDYQMMSRFMRGFASLMHADKPTVVKVHGYCVAGGTDIALHADRVVAAADEDRLSAHQVRGVPAAGLWSHRPVTRRQRLLLTGDCITPAPRPPNGGWPSRRRTAAHVSISRTERLVERIAAMPVNQLIMVKLAMNSALYQQGVATSRMVSTVFDEIARHIRKVMRSWPTPSSTGSARRCDTATNRSATSAKPPGSEHGGYG